MNIIIANIAGHPTEYLATRRDDCKDEIDAMVFDLVEKHKEIIAIGMVVGRPAVNQSPELN